MSLPARAVASPRCHSSSEQGGPREAAVALRIISKAARNGRSGPAADLAGRKKSVMDMFGQDRDCTRQRGVGSRGFEVLGFLLPPNQIGVLGLLGYGSGSAIVDMSCDVRLVELKSQPAAFWGFF